MKKSGITFIIIAAFAYLSLLTWANAGLNRALKSHEIQKLKGNIAKNPRNLTSREFLAEHYAKVKNFDQVIFYLKPMAEDLSEDSLNHLAQAYLAKNDLPGAESVTKIMLSRKELSVKGVRMLVLVWSAEIRQMPMAEASSRKLKIDQTVDILKKAEIAHPQKDELYKLHISFLKEFVDFFAFDGLKVIDDLEKALRSDDPDAELEAGFLSMRCEFNYLSNFTKKAQEECSKAINEDPQNHRNHIFLGRVFLKTGEVKKGQRMLASVGKKFSDNEDALRSTAEFHLEQKNLPKAYEFFKKATVHPGATAKSFLGLGKVAFELKKYGEALTAFTRHCKMTRKLDQEFRKASGLLKDQPAWQKAYRNTMRSCNANL